MLTRDNEATGANSRLCQTDATIIRVVRAPVLAHREARNPGSLRASRPASRSNGQRGLPACRSGGLDDVADGLGFSHAGGGSSSADELPARWPHDYVLVPGGVVIANEGDLVDADREQVGLSRLRAPAEADCHRVGVAALHRWIVLGTCGAADLELPFGAIAVGDHAVHEDARVSQEVAGFPRLPHHGQPQVAVHDEGLDRAESWRAVLSDRGHEYDARFDKALPSEPGQARLGVFHLRPVHGSSTGVSELLSRPAYHWVPTKQRGRVRTVTTAEIRPRPRSLILACVRRAVLPEPLLAAASRGGCPSTADDQGKGDDQG